MISDRSLFFGGDGGLCGDLSALASCAAVPVRRRCQAVIPLG